MSRHFIIVQLFLIAVIISSKVGAQEKVLLSTDRDIYIAGESMWLNVGAYMLDSNEFSNLSKVLYVELMNKKNVPVVQLKYRQDELCPQSKFLIPDSLSTGNYSLRAYTKWMQNNDKSLYAKKDVSIINPFVINSMPKGAKYFSGDTIFTFPEGGLLFSGVENKVMIRTYNSSGESKAMEGKVVDEDNKTLTSFKTNDDGYGLFKFIPEKNGVYFYCSDGIQLSLPTISNEKVYLQLSQQNTGIYSFKIHGDFTNNVCLDIVSKDGTFCRRYVVPSDGRVVVKAKDLTDNVFFALLVNDRNDVLAYRAFSSNKKEELPDIQLNTNKKSYSRREKVKLEIDQIKNLKNISVSVVKSCLLNHKFNKSEGIYPKDNDALIGVKPPIFIRGKGSRLLLPEVEGELITGVITCPKTGEPIVGEKFMLNFISQTPVMKFSTTDSLGQFRFVVNRYGEEEMVIQPFSNDTTLLHYKVTIDEGFSFDFGESKNEFLVLDSVKIKRINEAIVNMQVNKIYSSFSSNSASVIAKPELDAFYGKPSISTDINKYIDLPTVEEVVREIVRFTGIRRNRGEYYFRVLEEKSLYPRECKTLTFVDGVPIKNIKTIFEIQPQELKKIEVVNLNFYLQDEELGFLLCFYSKDNNLADMEFDQRIFRQVHKGFVDSYKYKSPDYSNPGVKNSHLADFRNVLYYNTFPQKRNVDNIKLSFYTSDEETEYTIVVKGINEQGGFVEGTINLNVSDDI